MLKDNTADGKLEPMVELASPTWENSDLHFVRYSFQILFKELKSAFIRFVVYRGNKVAYLRHLGVRIGKNSNILNSISNFGMEPWLIEIGQRVTITSGVTLLTHDAASRLFRDQLPNSSRYGNRFATIRIHDNCFIGMNSIIMPGVEIGPNSVIGAGSVVTRDVPPSSIVAGVPAKIISSLEDYIEHYKSIMIPIQATNRQELRRELTQRFWGEIR